MPIDAQQGDRPPGYAALVMSLLERHPRDALQVLLGVDPAGAQKEAEKPSDRRDRIAGLIEAFAGPDDLVVVIELGGADPEPVAIQFVDALARRGMSEVLEQTEAGREIARRSREEAYQESYREGCIEFMTIALEHAYGPLPDLPDLARRLATAANRLQHLTLIADRVPLEKLRSA
ncbi:hypothetical protein Adu01nite_86640 [Paractinoplanes durhamensis]|uniref:Uncharacterized protein n=2 Tax=Paractinoplanes durhamensis TaxID=113563 RepID=A0ABQ3ZBV1_9ACTN|nr:hypothetical protein Adu01nite_86640 [Actinoplanes durhamensis]